MEILSNDKIKEIKDSVDIVDVIGSYLPLTPKGKNFFGVCPFHDDHTPSMSVSKDKQIYTCFVCHETGNVYNFIMKYENISFKEALLKVANIANINIDINIDNKIQKKDNNLYEIYELSNIFKSFNNIEEVYGPSKVLNPLFNSMNKELTKEDILRIEDQFVEAALRAKKSGFDGVDIHSAHLTLLNQFLSPAFNKRNDENRARIIVEIIQKMRKVVGNDFIISIKISVNDGVEDGINEKGYLTACKLIEKAGAD